MKICESPCWLPSISNSMKAVTDTCTLWLTKYVLQMPTCIEYLLHVHGMSLSGITRHFLAQHQIKKDQKKWDGKKYT